MVDCNCKWLFFYFVHLRIAVLHSRHQPCSSSVNKANACYAIQQCGDEKNNIAITNNHCFFVFVLFVFFVFVVFFCVLFLFFCFCFCLLLSCFFTVYNNKIKHKNNKNTTKHIQNQKHKDTKNKKNSKNKKNKKTKTQKQTTTKNENNK